MQEAIEAQLMVQKAEAEALKKQDVATAAFMNQATESVIAQEKNKEDKKRQHMRQVRASTRSCYTADCCVPYIFERQSKSNMHIIHCI